MKRLTAMAKHYQTHTQPHLDTQCKRHLDLAITHHTKSLTTPSHTDAVAHHNTALYHLETASLYNFDLTLTTTYNGQLLVDLLGKRQHMPPM
jgi:hypothetical protein